MAIGPIDYTMQGVQAPGAAFLQGAQVGANVAQVQMQREAMQAKVEEARRAATEAQQRQDAQAAARAQFFANPRPTMRDALQFAQTLDKDQLAAFKPYIERLSADEQQSRLRFGLGVLSALESDPNVAANILTERAVAEENQGNTADAGFYRNLVESIRKGDPASAFKVATTLVAPLPGAKEAMEARAAARTAAEEGFTILSPAAAKAMNLPEGGTYQQNTKTKKVEVISGGSRFDVLPPSEVKRLGLSPGSYQRNAATGEIKALGTGGTTINMPPQIGQIPADHRLTYDAAGRPVSMEVIPGSPTARKLVEQEAGKATQAESAGMVANIVVQELTALRSRIQNQKALDPVTGLTGKAAEKIPGSARMSAQGSVDTIKANIGFERLNQMRQESPTGGALGNITEQELKFLQGVLGTINLDEKTEDTLRKIERLEKIYGDIMRKAAAYPNAAKYGFAPAGAAPAAAPAPAPAPAGGEFRLRGVRPSGG